MVPVSRRGGRWRLVGISADRVIVKRRKDHGAVGRPSYDESSVGDDLAESLKLANDTRVKRDRVLRPDTNTALKDQDAAHAVLGIDVVIPASSGVRNEDVISAIADGDVVREPGNSSKAHGLTGDPAVVDERAPRDGGVLGEATKVEGAALVVAYRRLRKDEVDTVAVDLNRGSIVLPGMPHFEVMGLELWSAEKDEESFPVAGCGTRVFSIAVGVTPDIVLDRREDDGIPGDTLDIEFAPDEERSDRGQEFDDHPGLDGQRLVFEDLDVVDDMIDTPCQGAGRIIGQRAFKKFLRREERGRDPDHQDREDRQSRTRKGVTRAH